MELLLAVNQKSIQVLMLLDSKVVEKKNNNQKLVELLGNGN